MLPGSLIGRSPRHTFEIRAAAQPPVTTPRPDERTRSVIDRFVRLPGVFDVLRFGGTLMFKRTAEKHGIPWDERVMQYEAIQPELEKIFEEIENPSVEYPWYYLQRFHAYENGNLNWRAAFEVESAREVLAFRLFQVDPKEAKTKLRENLVEIIKERMSSASKVLDLGCGTGCSSTQLAEAFPDAHVTGIDLSPHFLSVARLQQKETDGPVSRIEYVHMDAEKATEYLPNAAFDLVNFLFVFHECPPDAIQSMVNVAFKLCRPGGLIAISDGNATSTTVQNLSVWRKALQQMTEPFLLDYYNVDMQTVLEEAGFHQVKSAKVSPRHITWTAIKPTL